MARKYQQGVYTPINPEKYAGNPKNIIFRSGLERRFFKRMDENPDIVAWASEELFVEYISPVDNQIHRYFVDLLIKTKANEVFMIEIKPDSETRPPKKGRKSQATFLAESVTWAVNEAKWKYAEAYCQKRGWKFVILTEKHLKVE